MSPRKQHGLQAIGLGALALASIVFSNIQSTRDLLTAAQASGGLPKMIAELLLNPAFQVLLVLVALGLGLKAVRTGMGASLVDRFQPIGGQQDIAPLQTDAMTAQASFRWLSNIADAELLPDAISVVSELRETDWRTTGSAPHLVITLLMWNLAVRPISIIPALTGRISYAGSEFPDQPEFLEPPPEEVPHGRGVVVRLRQPVSGRVLFHMREKALRGCAVMTFEKLYLYALLDPRGAQVRKRVETAGGLVLLPGEELLP